MSHPVSTGRTARTPRYTPAQVARLTAAQVDPRRMPTGRVTVRRVGIFTPAQRREIAQAALLLIFALAIVGSAVLLMVNPLVIPLYLAGLLLAAYKIAPLTARRRARR